MTFYGEMHGCDWLNVGFANCHIFHQDNEGMENALRTLDGVALKGLDLRLEKVVKIPVHGLTFFWPGR